jgi:hypothetical protein
VHAAAWKVEQGPFEIQPLRPPTLSVGSLVLMAFSSACSTITLPKRQRFKGVMQRGRRQLQTR